mmetsp:Transcript_884/g.2051  ORF Transcript_884/g.2051 Transcript_884/m.2051 type:complete len:313 (-) Transcript_884:127-1065(-)
MPVGHARGGDRHPQDGASVVVGVGEAVEDEVAEAVDHRLAVDQLDVLAHMGMGSDHRVGAGADHQACQCLLAGVGGVAVLLPPVHIGDDNVRLPPSGPDVGDDLLLIGPSDAGLRRAGLEVAREHFVVAEQGDAQPVALHDGGAVRSAQVAAAPEIGQPGFLQALQHLGEGLGPVVSGVVVGQRHRIDMAAQHVHRMRMRSEGPRFGDLPSSGGDHAFQVGHAQIGVLQRRSHMLEGVAALRDDAARSIGEHDVAHPGQACRGRVSQRGAAAVDTPYRWACLQGGVGAVPTLWGVPLAHERAAPRQLPAHPW